MEFASFFKGELILPVFWQLLVLHDKFDKILMDLFLALSHIKDIVVDQGSLDVEVIPVDLRVVLV